MENIERLLYNHLTRYPGMEPEDAIVLLYQHVYGYTPAGQGLAALESDFARRLSSPVISSAAPEAPVGIGNDLCRVALGNVDVVSALTLAKICVRSAELHSPSPNTLMQALHVLRGMADEGRLPWNPVHTAHVIDAYVDNDCPFPVHSARYVELYAPNYIVMDRVSAFFMQVFQLVDRALAQKSHVLVGIDGMSAAGKSHLAALLAEVYACGVVHADDFFLRPEQRNSARLAQPGGNIDYERLAPVAKQAADNRAFSYVAYSCKTGRLEEQRHIPAGRITVLEGVYSLSPRVAAQCDVRVFLSVDAAKQMERVTGRSGAELAVRFKQEWIPMENYYFSEYSVRESCDIALDTTVL